MEKFKASCSPSRGRGFAQKHGGWIGLVLAVVIVALQALQQDLATGSGFEDAALTAIAAAALYYVRANGDVVAGSK